MHDAADAYPDSCKGRSDTEREKLNGSIRIARPEDAEAILGIYAPYIENTSVTFEYEVPSVSEFAVRMENIQKKYPWIVYEENEEILGYAYGGPMLTRAAYQWTVESSVYVSEKVKGKGIGSQLYDVLLDTLTKQGFCVCYALVIAENAASVKMHEKYGFSQVGFLENSGYKFAGWHSVIIMEKRLNDFVAIPEKVIPIGELKYGLV